MKISFNNYWVIAATFLLPLSIVRGQVGNNNPTGPSGDFNGTVTTAGEYDPFTGNSKRGPITDLSVPGAVGKYGLSHSRTWNSRQGGWSQSFGWHIASVFRAQTDPMYYRVSFPDGRVVTYNGAGTGPGGVRERLQLIGNSSANLLLPDGGQVQFSVHMTTIPGNPQDGTPTYLSYDFTTNVIIDPYGQRITYSYINGVLDKLIEPAGRYIQYFYRTDGQLDHIQSSDGRRVDYIYSAQTFPPGTTSYNVLTSVKYFSDPSVVATYTYDKPNVGDANGAPVLKSCNDPMYDGPMKKISYTYATGNNADGGAAVYGEILSENSGTTGQAVSTLRIYFQTRTETRGDGKTRTFTYSSDGSPFLISVTDFKGVAQTQTYDIAKFVNAVTDRNGHTTNYTNNSLGGGVTVIQYPSTPTDTPPGTPRGTVYYTYGSASCPDPNNRDANNPYYLYSVLDEGGHATIFTRDTSKRVIRVDHPDGAYETFGYNSFGQVTSHRMKSGGNETWSYDSTGKLTDYRDPFHASGNQTARYQYDSRGRVSAITDALGTSLGDVNHTTTFTYNERGQLLTTTYPPDGNGQPATTLTNVYGSDGTLTSVTDQLGSGSTDVLHTTTYAYDDYRRVRTITTPQRAVGDNTPRTTSLSYDRNQGTGDDYTHTDSNVTLVTLPSGNIVKTHYDENYRKDWVQTSAADGVTDAAKTTYEYDNFGNLRFVTAPNQQPSGPKTTYNYDERNRPMSIVDPLNNTTSLKYDAAGRKASVTRPNGQVISYDSYDAMNRVLQQTVKQTPEPDAVTKYTYYTSGLLNTMQDPRLVALNNTYKYVYSYDSMGRKTSLSYPPDSNNVQRTESWHYDNVTGRNDSFTNRAGAIQAMSYDWLNRLTGFSWSDGTQTQTMHYDKASRITSIQNAEADLTFAYDNAGFKTSETETIKSYGLNQTRSVIYAPNADGVRGRLLYPQGYDYRYGYTGRNQLKTIGLSWLQTPTVQYAYDPSGNRTTRTLYPGAYTNYDVNELNLVRSQTSYFANNRTARFDYSFDNVNRMKYEQRDSALADGFQYDLNGELVQFSRDGTLNTQTGTVTAAYNVSITYDANGNRIDAIDGGNAHYVTNNVNQYSSDWTGPMTYDVNGNLTGRQGWTYTYDAQNRLVALDNNGANIHIHQHYDGLNRIVARDSNGAITTNVWDKWDLIEEHYGNGALKRCYLHGAATNEMVVSFDGGTYGDAYYHQDARGNTTHLTDGSNNVIEHYTYYVSGQPSYYTGNNSPLSASAYDNRFLFGGALYSPETSLYDMRNRFYLPNIGRFLQSDPIGFAGDPSNLYRYCGNNPVNRHDPSGLAGPDERPLQNGPGWEGLPSAQPVNVFGRDPFDLMGWGGTAYYPDGGSFGTYNLDPAFGSGGWGRGNWGALGGNSFLGKPYNPQSYFKELTLPQFSPASTTNPNISTQDLTQNPFGGPDANDVEGEWRQMLVTAFNDSTGDHDNRLGRGDVATGDQRYSSADFNSRNQLTRVYGGAPDRAIPAGTGVDIYRQDGTIYFGTISDTGAGFAAHRPDMGLPNGVAPGNWLDIWTRRGTENPEWDWVFIHP